MCFILFLFKIKESKMHNQYGILNAKNVTCQHLEAPEILETDNATTAESTFQLPFGDSSALSELRLGNLKNVEALLLTVLNYRSNWDSGKTWKTSLKRLSELTGLSIRYIRDTLTSLRSNGWINRLSIGSNTGSRYEVTHHNCSRDETPTDKNGNPLKCAIPQGKNGILERLFNGDISWKAALIWILMKLHSDWKTGETMSLTIETLRKWAGMSPQTISDCLVELTKAGLIKRLSKRHEAGIYQLYPKPNTKPKPVHRRRKPKAQNNEKRQMRVDGDYRLSFNELWRINVETAAIETRRSRRIGLWKQASDYQISQMPKAIKRDFDMCIDVVREMQNQFGKTGVTDTAHSVTDTAHSVTDTAQPLFLRGNEPSIDKGSQTSPKSVPDGIS